MSRRTVLALCITIALNFCAHTTTAQCGKGNIQPNLEARTRVVNGVQAVPNSWPWTVWILWRGDNGMGFTCGGTLLGLASTPGKSDMVATAAHCVLDEHGQMRESGRYTVFIGNHDTHIQERGEAQIGVRRYVYHGDYYPINNDVALLQLTQPVTFSTTIQPVCLPSVGQQPSDPNNCYAAGWGHENDQSARQLQQVRLPVLSDDICAQTWQDQFDPSTMLCAGYLNGSKNVCNGDSGGPLVCQENGRWVLFGSVSFGNKGACAVAYKPGVFARVSNFRPWFEEQIQRLHSN